VCDLETNETFTSQDVIFCGKQFPFARTAQQQDALDSSTLWEPNVPLGDDFGLHEDLAYPTQQQRMEDAGGSLDEALGPVEALALHLLPPGEHEDKGSPSRSPVEYVGRGSLVAQQCQPDSNEGGVAAAQNGERPSMPNATT